MSTRTKRLFDVIGAIGGLIFFALPMAAIAAAILVLDGRPILFRQPRLGRWRRPFTILKFRTMRDGEVTAIGRVLRSTGLDELPQLVNVLRGDLSAVGPRPLTEADVQRLGWTAPAYDFRWSVPPGLTGLAQVVGMRSARHALRLDRYYIARQNFRLDVRLIAWSFAINVLGKARVRRLISGVASDRNRWGHGSPPPAPHDTAVVGRGDSLQLNDGTAERLKGHETADAATRVG